MISDQIVQDIQRNLLAWYYNHRRDLPWRRSSDPYRIWVSEIMLQQTRVDTVIPYYNRFIAQFPTLERLACAPEEQVLKAWEGLGYYSRARNLQYAAKQVMIDYGGEVPTELAEISTLKGVGPYTAGAILSIAYNKKVPAIDGNVMRVFSRLFMIQEDIMLSSTRKKMDAIAYRVISNEFAGDFNQALMELGATICLPTSAACSVCPLVHVCESYREGVQNRLPVKKKARPQVEKQIVFMWIEYDEEILIEKRDRKGLLAGMWGLPTIELETEDQTTTQVVVQWMKERSWQGLYDQEGFGDIRHVFSHRVWNVNCIRIKKYEKCLVSGNEEWIKKSDLIKKAFPVVYQKAIALAGE